MTNIKKKLKPLKRHLRRLFNLNHRKLIWLLIICCIFLAGVYKQHRVEAYQYRLRVNKALYDAQIRLQELFQQVDSTKDQLDKKTQQARQLRLKIQQLEKDLQAKKDRQSFIAKIVSPKVYAESNCVTGYSTNNYALNQLIAHESGGRSCATNPNGCFGLLQACPGSPLRLACGGDPTCQINWFINNKTGGRSWETIWAEWQVKGWW